MPEDSKKNQDKKKNDPKEQRKPRNARNQASKGDKKTEKAVETKSVPKVPQKPPVYDDPGPEFYKNLKRETEDILKITEEENSKYKKKEIQSNWSKYEMPIETYEDVEEHDIGADYEKLIQAPLSIGSHFQFKHEKSWDVNTGPSLYDKYFEINMDNLSLAVSTIPFYERNSVELSLFSENDILTMNNRATKYKQKYFDDKSYSTSETEAHDKTLSSLKEALSKNQVDVEKDEDSSENIAITPENIQEDRFNKDDTHVDLTFRITESAPSPAYTEEVKKKENKTLESKMPNVKPIDDIDELLLQNTLREEKVSNENIVENTHMENKLSSKNIIDPPTPAANIEDHKSKESNKQIKKTDIPVDTKKNPVIESPEDLEKWLDDFLDG